MSTYDRANARCGSLGAENLKNKRLRYRQPYRAPPFSPCSAFPPSKRRRRSKRRRIARIPKTVPFLPLPYAFFAHSNVGFYLLRPRPRALFLWARSRCPSLLSIPNHAMALLDTHPPWGCDRPDRRQTVLLHMQKYAAEPVNDLPMIDDQTHQHRDRM